MTRISLIVPSYGRPDQVIRCLDSAHRQSRPFDEVIVVVRDSDDASRAALAGSTDAVLTVDAPGVLAAIRAGVERASGDILAFTDDDAELTEDWCARVGAFFDDPQHDRVGGFGGRDRIYDGDEPRPTVLRDRVGVITWWGRVIGNHHCGRGPVRDVAALKAVNAAYRRDAFGLPSDLRGTGAQANFEIAVGLFARSHGWRLCYDPSLQVHHHPAARLGEDQREAPSDHAIADSAFNVLRGLSPDVQTRRWVYVHLVGDRACPGLLRLAWAVLHADRATIRRRRPAWRGTSDAWRERQSAEQFVTFTPTDPQ